MLAGSSQQQPQGQERACSSNSKLHCRSRMDARLSASASFTSSKPVQTHMQQPHSEHQVKTFLIQTPGALPLCLQCWRARAIPTLTRALAPVDAELINAPSKVTGSSGETLRISSPSPSRRSTTSLQLTAFHSTH